jgi:hypothetical protein
MPIYVTKPQMDTELDKKIDKTSILTVKTGNPTDEQVMSAKLLNTLITNQNYPSDLKKCIEEFDNMYLGYKATNPTQDINGKALSTGLLYYNTTDKQLMVYDGNMWQKTLSTIPFTMPLPISVKNFDVEVTAVTNTVFISGGYNKDDVSVYLNGIRMSIKDFTATDGATISFAMPLAVGDVVSGFYTDEGAFKLFDTEVLVVSDTVTVPNGYDKKTLSVYLNGIRMSTDDFVATDGITIRFKKDLAVNDVVSGFSYSQDSTIVPLVQEYTRIEDAPTPTTNGSLAWDLSREALFYYSTTRGAWVCKNSASIGFYDLKEEFEDPTVAVLDKLYIDRSTKRFYLFDGTKYIDYGVVQGKGLPSPSEASTGSLYIDTDNEQLAYFNGTSFVTVADGKSEPIQKKNNFSDFIYTGHQTLFLDATQNKLYQYDGAEFKPIVNSGVGEVEFISGTTSVNTKERLYVDTSNGKTYYYDNNAIKRANKEIWRVGTEADLTNISVKDEDFVYLVDDINVLKKYDKQLNRFENLGSPSVIHRFVKESEIAKAGEIPTTLEAKNHANAKGYTDCLMWGNGLESGDVATWIYSVDSNGDVLLLKTTDTISVVGYCAIDTEQTISNKQLKVTITTGIITVVDGAGNTINVVDVSSDGNISDGQGILSVWINGNKVPKALTSISGNTVTIDTSKFGDTLYVGNYIEISK